MSRSSELYASTEESCILFSDKERSAFEIHQNI
jgi:hypothetical protein